MTAEKANLTKKIPSSPKKNTFFRFSNSTCGRGLVRNLLAPYRCVKFEREKKLFFFFVEEIVFRSDSFLSDSAPPPAPPGAGNELFLILERGQNVSKAKHSA
jgi:hypothetical protein